MAATKDQIIANLQKAYSMEVETVMNYLANSLDLEGVRAEFIKQALAVDIQEELGHAQQLGHRIKQLGGTVPGSTHLEMTHGLELVPAACCICGGTDGEPVAVGEDFEYRTSPDSFLAVRCPRCDLVYLDPPFHAGQAFRMSVPLGEGNGGKVAAEERPDPLRTFRPVPLEILGVTPAPFDVGASVADGLVGCRVRSVDRLQRL